MNRLSIRCRLTAWYGAVLLAILIGFSAAVYFIMHRALVSRLDDALAEELSEIVRETSHAPTWDALDVELHRQFASHEGYEFQVLTSRGEVRFRSRGLHAVALPTHAAGNPFRGGSYLLAGLGTWRIQSRHVDGPGQPLVVQAAAALAPIDEQMNRLLTVLLLAGPLALAAALAGGYALARQALAPVDRMVAAAEAISATSLDRRLDAPNAGDELGRLARTLNGMIARIERSFGEIQRFTGDAAHELRTPLSVMRNEAEVALRSPRTPEEYRDVLGAMLEEIDRMTQLAEQLLFLCRLDTGRLYQRHEPVAMSKLFRKAVDSLRTLAETKGITLKVHCQDDGWVIGNPPQLRRLLVNLLDNAIKYTPSGGQIVGSIERAEGQIHVVVEDTGTGIAAAHLPHVCERFYRADTSRDYAVEGTGLGLSICQAIAEAHAGEFRIESEAGRGTRCLLVIHRFAGRVTASLAQPQLS